MFYCGIDVAKRKHAVVVLDDRGHVQKKVFETENSHAGLERLVKEIGFESVEGAMDRIRPLARPQA